jgi:uncharacterized lipoprotein YajG
MMRHLAVITAFLLLQACAFTDATLKVEHDSAVDITGPISEVGGIVFTAPQLEDARLDKARIGWKKNGYGMNTADITSEQPVDVIVADAIIDAIKDNGHSISEDGQVRIIGTVDRFWFDTDINFWSLEFIGDVQCTLDFIDSASNTSIYRSSYSGNYKEKTAAGYVKTWTEVMSQAIDKLIEDIVFDEDLKEALAGYK